MALHTNKQCRKKCESIKYMLSEINKIIEYPRSDREQLIKIKVDLALQDLGYISMEIGDMEE